MKDDGPSKSKGRKRGGDRAKAAGNSGTRVEGGVHGALGSAMQFTGAHGLNVLFQTNHFSQRHSPQEICAAYASFIRAQCDKVWQPGAKARKRPLLGVYADMQAIPTQFSVEVHHDPPGGDDLIQMWSSHDARDEGDDDHDDTGRHHGDASGPEVVARGRIKVGPVLNVAADSDRLVLLGPPGGGKSTFLRYLALKLVNAWPSQSGNADGGEAASLESKTLPAVFDGFVPVWIELRKLRWSHEAHPWGWPRILAAHAKALKEQDWGDVGWPEIEALLRSAMERGRVLFLLDGLDEVTRITEDAEDADPVPDLFGLHEAILQVADWRPPGVDSHQDDKPFNRVLVTCRETSWRDGWEIEGWVDRGTMERRGGMVATLSPLGDDERLSFLTAWFGNPDHARRVHQHVLDPVRDWQKRLSEMASVPLNLTMIAWLAERRLSSGILAALPATRAAIYEQVVHAILWEIDDEKELGKEGEQTLSALVGTQPERREQFVQWLAQVAYQSLGGMRLDQGSLLDSYAKARYGNRHGHFQSKAVAVLRTVQCRAGILRLETPEKQGNEVSGSYDFVHRSFCEYLAALYFIHGPIPSDGKRLSTRAIEWLDAKSGEDMGVQETRELIWEPLRLAAGYFVVGKEERKPLLPGGQDVRPIESLEGLIQALARRCKQRPQDAWLAGEIALQAGPSISNECMGPLRDAMVVAMQSDALPERQRVEVGRVLAQLGDHRPGVAPRNPPGKGEPFFAWSEEIAPVTFTMGGDPHAWGGGHAVQRTFQRPYRIARYPVTNAQYDCFENSPYFGQNASKQGWRKRGRSDVRFLSPNQPVVNVDWHHAMGFCEWVNALGLSARELGLPDSCGGQRWSVRLPSEAEWERAARWPDDRWLPWLPRTEEDKTAPKAEKQSLQGYCNWAKGEVNATSPVGMYPNGASPCGAEDMIGNVWEWTRTRWREVPDRSEDGDIRDEDGHGTRVLRGGSWIYVVPENLRCASRYVGDPWYSYDDIGFRVVCVGVLASGG